MRGVARRGILKPSIRLSVVTERVRITNRRAARMGRRTSNHTHFQKEVSVKRLLLLPAALMMALAAFTVPATADENDVVAQAAASPAPSPSPTPAPNPLTLSGYVDGGLDTASASGPRGVLNTRVFDNVNNVPQLQTVNLTAGYTGVIGGKVELNTGTDAIVMHSYPMNPTVICPAGPFTCTAPYNIQSDLTQAYIAFNVSKFTLIFGKFETLAGAEVIESPSDLNFSRSILFGYAVPFTHTGARLTFAVTPQISLIVGANRGWDTTYGLTATQLGKLGAPAGTPADNSTLTMEYGAAWNPSSAIGLTVQGYNGRQQDWVYVGCATNTGCTRSLLDVVGTWHVNPILTAQVNFDAGQQTGTCSPSFVFTGGTLTCGAGVGTATWNGLAGYVSVAPLSYLTLSARYEGFSDAQGYRIGNGIGTRWSEGTLTATYLANAHLTFRLEGRADNATQPIFASSHGPAFAQNTLTTFGFEAIVHVP
jgi:hypothetical protein